MQKFSAWRKCSSDIQRRFSMISRCIIEICPAGPPKLIQPSFHQRRSASPKVGWEGGFIGGSSVFPAGKKEDGDGHAQRDADHRDHAEADQGFAGGKDERTETNDVGGSA